MPVEYELVAENINIPRTTGLFERLVNEAPDIIAPNMASKMKAGDRQRGTYPARARADRVTKLPVRTGKYRRSWTSQGGQVVNTAEYANYLEYQNARWKGSARRFIDSQLTELAQDLIGQHIPGEFRG